MIDGLKILDTFEYKGVQGFVHADLSLSSIVKLEEFGDVSIMNEIEQNKYYSAKEKIINSLSPFGNGNLIPHVKSIGGSLYQYFAVPNERFDEELNVIKFSNNNKTFYKALLDQVVVEEMEKVTKNYANLKKYENYITIRTYLSSEEEGKFQFTLGKKKYKKNKFVALYTKLLENSFETEQLKEQLFASLNNLFEKHKSAATKFGSSSSTSEKITSNGLVSDLQGNQLLDILGQINAVRSYFSLPKKKLFSANNQSTFQIFDTGVEFEPSCLKIDTNREKFLIYGKYDILLYEIYEDENGAVIIEDKKKYDTYIEYNSYLLDNLKGEIENFKPGIYIVKDDGKENFNTQFPIIFLEQEDKSKMLSNNEYLIKKEKLYKYYQLYSVETIPENIYPNLGENIIKTINNELSGRIIKANLSINFFKPSHKQLNASISLEKAAWKTVASLPDLWTLGYEPELVNDKIDALEEISELVKKGKLDFLTSQLFITVVSYQKVDVAGDIENLMQGSAFSMDIVQENYMADVAFFASASPLAYNLQTIKQDKELFLTSSDMSAFINLSVGPNQMSLTRPVIIGISNGTRVCYVDSYDPRIEAPNGIVVGATGSGKSFTKIYELVKLLFLPVHPLIIIVDRGGSFMNFVKIFGGRAVQLNLSSPKNNINPFIYDANFRKYIIYLSKHNIKEISVDNIDKEYVDKDGYPIYLMDNGIFYTRDDNDIFHIMLPNDLSPQIKMNFFTRIIQSMSQSKEEDFKKIIADSLLSVIDNNENIYIKKKTIFKNTILVKDKTTNEILFNTENVLKYMENGNVFVTDSYKLKEFENKVFLEYLDIVGYKKEYSNAKIEKLEKNESTEVRVFYFTVEDVKNELLKYENQKYQKEINILDKYIDFTAYGNLFNGPPALDFDEELLWTVDMGEETPDDLSAVILQSLNIVQWNAILSPQNKNRKKMIIFDEVHSILADVQNTGPAEAIGYMYRTIRKHGGGIHILSQSSADIFKNSDEVPKELLNVFNGIKSNAMYKYIIGINSIDAARSQVDFQLTDSEVAEIVDFSGKKSTVPAMRGMLYINTKAFKGFLNVIATPTIYAIATTMKEEKNLQDAIEKMLKQNEQVKNFFEIFEIDDDRKKLSIITAIKIVIFKSLFPGGIGSVYGSGSKDIFLKKHIDKQPDGTDKNLEGFKDYLHTSNSETRYTDIVANELRKLEESIDDLI